jgi:hypothetical protein
MNLKGRTNLELLILLKGVKMYRLLLGIAMVCLILAIIGLCYAVSEYFIQTDGVVVALPAIMASGFITASGILFTLSWNIKSKDDDDSKFVFNEILGQYEVAKSLIIECADKNNGGFEKTRIKMVCALRILATIYDYKKQLQAEHVKVLYAHEIKFKNEIREVIKASPSKLWTSSFEFPTSFDWENCAKLFYFI